MADRAKKISELTAATGAANSDIMLLVVNTAGTAVTKKIGFSNVVSSVGALLSVNNNINVSNTQVAFGNSTNGLTSSNTFTFNGSEVTITSNVVVGIAGSGVGVLHLHGAVASNVGPDTPNNYFLGNTSHPWKTLWASTIRTANISYTDTDIVIQMAGNTASYLQSVLQNVSAAANASTNYNVSADTANATSNFGEFGINSSTFTGTGRFSDPLAVYVAAATSNLAVGTYEGYPVHIVVNSSINWTFGTDSSLTLPSGPVIFTGNATTRAAVNTQVGAAGSNGSIYLSTAGKIYLRVDGTGTATTDWQRVTTTSAD